MILSQYRGSDMAYSKKVMWRVSGNEGTPIYDKNDLSPDWQPMPLEEFEKRRKRMIQRIAKNDSEFMRRYNEL